LPILIKSGQNYKIGVNGQSFSSQEIGNTKGIKSVEYMHLFKSDIHNFPYGLIFKYKSTGNFFKRNVLGSDTFQCLFFNSWGPAILELEISKIIAKLDSQEETNVDLDEHEELENIQNVDVRNANPKANEKKEEQKIMKFENSAGMFTVQNQATDWYYGGKRVALRHNFYINKKNVHFEFLDDKNINEFGTISNLYEGNCKTNITGNQTCTFLHDDVEQVSLTTLLKVYNKPGVIKKLVKFEFKSKAKTEANIGNVAESAIEVKNERTYAFAFTENNDWNRFDHYLYRLYGEKCIRVKKDFKGVYQELERDNLLSLFSNKVK
jgi:hypothetical protein